MDFYTSSQNLNDLKWFACLLTDMSNSLSQSGLSIEPVRQSSVAQSESRQDPANQSASGRHPRRVFASQSERGRHNHVESLLFAGSSKRGRIFCPANQKEGDIFTQNICQLIKRQKYPCRVFVCQSEASWRPIH